MPIINLAFIFDRWMTRKNSQILIHVKCRLEQDLTLTISSYWWKRWLLFGYQQLMAGKKTARDCLELQIISAKQSCSLLFRPSIVGLWYWVSALLFHWMIFGNHLKSGVHMEQACSCSLTEVILFFNIMFLIYLVSNYVEI